MIMWIMGFIVIVVGLYIYMDFMDIIWMTIWMIIWMIIWINSDLMILLWEYDEYDGYDGNNGN
jgi:hypothetical protein